MEETKWYKKTPSYREIEDCKEQANELGVSFDSYVKAKFLYEIKYELINIWVSLEDLRKQIKHAKHFRRNYNRWERNDRINQI